MNKDTVLGMFKWLDNEDAELYKNYKLPIFISKDLFGWLKSRTPPKHREHIQELLKQCGLYSTKDIIDFSKGLSLSDTLWITNNDNTSLNSVSLFTNDFNEKIGKIAFTGGMFGIGFSTTSPEFGTNGMLPKCWVKENNDIVLCKGETSGFSNTGNEPYSEVLADQVLNCLKYNHVNYWLAQYHGSLVSKCKLFTSEHTMLLPLHLYFDIFQLTEVIDRYNHLNLADDIARYMIFDFLSYNTDRHAGNIGVLLDADTFEYISIAPIYDNGCSMLCYWNGDDDLEYYTNLATPALYSSFNRGARLGKKILKNKHNVQNLISFKFDRSLIPGFPENRLVAIEDWLQTRVRKFFAL